MNVAPVQGSSPARAKELVIFGVLVSGVIVAVGQIAKTGDVPSSRVGFGVFIAVALLSLLAEVAPDLAASFAMLMLVTAVFVEGGPAFTQLAKITGGKSTKSNNQGSE